MKETNLVLPASTPEQGSKLKMQEQQQQQSKFFCLLGCLGREGRNCIPVMDKGRLHRASIQEGTLSCLAF